MRKPKHTPGPWRFVTDIGRGGNYLTLESDNGTALSSSFLGELARPGIMGHGVCGPEEALANARLIAAAPDLLNALQQTAEICREYDPEGVVTKLAWTILSRVEGSEE